MNTVFDIISVVMFCGLVVLFLKRSLAFQEAQKLDPEAALPDHLWQYLVAAIGCAAGNISGNHNYAIAAVILFTATLIFILRVLKPFSTA